MRLRVELGLHLLGLRAAVVMLGFGAVALFGRMSPAIEHILAENVVTLEATEQMLVALADPALDAEAARADFEAGLERAKANITEDAERPLIDAIERLTPRAFATPSSGARARLVGKVVALAEVNRRSMEERDAAARRLGLAGAWAVVVVALLILGLTTLMTRRLEARMLGPLVTLSAQAQKIRSGDVYLRCTEAGAPEIMELAALTNELLDNQHSPRPPQRLARADRQIVLHLLDRRPGPWLVADEDGELIACNKEALERIEQRGHPTREEVLALRTEGESERVHDATLWLTSWR